jgi:hypothetical protein
MLALFLEPFLEDDVQQPSVAKSQHNSPPPCGAGPGVGVTAAAGQENALPPPPPGFGRFRDSRHPPRKGAGTK